MRDLALILHFLGLVMGMGTPISLVFLNTAAKKLNPEDAMKFKLNCLILRRMGHVGYSLLIISGLYLLLPYYSIITEQALLIIKLVLVVLLGALIGMASANMRRATESDSHLYLKKLRRIGPFAVLTGLTILIISVILFN